MKTTRIEYTNPLEKCLSGLSHYQYYVFLIIFLSKVPLLWHILNLIFLSPPMDFNCDDGKINQCPCENPTWNRSVFTETMQTKFAIYCDNTWLISLAHSMSFFGALLGCLIFGFLSDRFGRLTILSISYLIIATSGCTISVMPSLTYFVILRFIEGVGVGGAIVTSYVLCIEYCSTEYREIVSALYHVPLNIGHITLPGISYLLRHMDSFQLAISVPVFFFIALRWLIRESPKWLMDNNHLDELMVSMKKICPKSEVTRDVIEAYHAANDNPGVNKVQFWDIFKHKAMTVNFVCMAVNYFVCGMGYYGVSQFIGAMEGNIHINVAISGVIVIPGTILSIFLLGRFSRRNFLMVSNFLAGTFMLAVVCTPETFNWLRVVFACFANCFLFVSFIVIFLYGVELFPTSVRSSVLGVLSVVARIGQTVTPPINSLSQTISGSIFGVMAIIGGLFCIPLPETKNTELPSSMRDVKEINKNTRLSILSKK